MSAPINHNVAIKKPYKAVQELLEPHYINTSEEKDDYKYITSDLVIILYSLSKKETKVTISFPCKKMCPSWEDQQINRSTSDLKQEMARNIQSVVCKIYNILNKRYHESSDICLQWKNLSSGLYFVYPQFVFELTHNLPGKDFLHVNSGFKAKINVNIYDKTLYGKVGITRNEYFFYEVNMEFVGKKVETGVEIFDSNYHQSHNQLMQLLPEYVDKFGEWLSKSCATGENKNSMLCDFITHIVEVMKYNN